MLEKKFFVRDMNVSSTTHSQYFGISQGCPLSPFLLIIAMTIMIHDAHEKLTTEFGAFINDLPVNY